GHSGRPRAARRLDPRLQRRGAWRVRPRGGGRGRRPHTLADPASHALLWDDGGPVSLAAAVGPTPNGIRIVSVYTPPPLRGRGYAGACVAELTARMLTRYRFCFLYADLANPTSNAIYQRLGYHPVGDAGTYAFSG
ncbi:MAG: GNAT family N-acetyltransferase, partial [Actinomycetota bacterium]|nr:GNAT family N-acetyltransferase [Actinomycetota bacterium]